MSVSSSLCLSVMSSVFRGRTVLPACASAHRHALTQPTPNPYEGSFNSNLPFRDCSESCIFLSWTNVYHSITNHETFVPVSRPTFRLPPCVDWLVSSDISFDRNTFLPCEKLRTIISCVSLWSTCAGSFLFFVTPFFPHKLHVARHWSYLLFL